MKKIRKAVIPVAGMGTRFLPVTKTIPKEMLPIINKPTLQYLIEEAVNSGIEEILLITNPYKKAIEDYFDVSYELEDRLLKNNKLEQLEMLQKISSMVKVYYIRQGEPLGTGHAISLAKTFIGNEPFAIMYGDDLIKSEIPALKQLIDVYEKYDCNVIGVQKVDPNVVNRYGIIDYEDEKTGKIKGLVEKPKIGELPSNYAGLGRYILKSEIFDELEKIDKVNGEYLLTDAMLRLMKKQPFYDCRFEGIYYDIGNQFGYLKANIEYGLEREDIRGELMKYVNNFNEK
ncbi:MAG: UTP--glucose-1-phosphate uridylyltransferase [Mollicutes bacterium]|nr:UTP--glucose-1-phosphate uridylyltransferase [Mollicutes bacterium]